MILSHRKAPAEEQHSPPLFSGLWIVKKKNSWGFNFLNIQEIQSVYPANILLTVVKVLDQV